MTTEQPPPDLTLAQVMVQRAIAGMRPGLERRVLVQLLADGYDFEQPKSTHLLAEYAEACDVTPKTIRRAVNAALADPVFLAGMASAQRSVAATRDRDVSGRSVDDAGRVTWARNWSSDDDGQNRVGGDDTQPRRSRHDYTRGNWSWSGRELKACNWPGVEPWASDWGSPRHLKAAAARFAAWHAAGRPLCATPLVPYAWPRTVLETLPRQGRPVRSRLWSEPIEAHWLTRWPMSPEDLARITTAAAAQYERVHGRPWADGKAGDWLPKLAALTVPTWEDRPRSVTSRRSASRPVVSVWVARCRDGVWRKRHRRAVERFMAGAPTLYKAAKAWGSAPTAKWRPYWKPGDFERVQKEDAAEFRAYDLAVRR